MQPCITESGLQLFARIREKRNLSDLQNILFYNGLDNTDIVEIAGHVCSGKTFLLSELAARCILPKEYNGVQIKGCNGHCVLINTDHHFQISNLTKLMSRILCDTFKETTVKGSDEIVNDIVQKSLDNLILINCYNSDQFTLTLHTLDDVLLRNEKISVLAIDSISAFYWQDRENKGVFSLNAYIDNLIKITKTYTSQFNVVTIYTRPSKFKNSTEESDTESNVNEIKYKISVHRDNKTQKSQCLVSSMSSIKIFDYIICENEIKWCEERRNRK